MVRVSRFGAESEKLWTDTKKETDGDAQETNHGVGGGGMSDVLRS